MKKIKSIFTIFICVTVFSGGLSADMRVPSQHNIIGINLSPVSVLNGLTDLEGRDIARIKFALETQLREYIDEKKRGKIKWENLTKTVSRKEETIFNPADMQFFFREAELTDDTQTRLLRCRIKDEKGQRDYYALCSLIYDADEKGFTIKDIFTEKEIVNATLERKGSDRTEIERYTENNERIIDTFIRERMDAGDFTEFLGRAQELGWDDLYPERKKPEQYLLSGIMNGGVGIKDYLDPFLALFGTDIKKVLDGKNVVFIKIPFGEKPPVIKEKGISLDVRSHTSANAVYLFFEERKYQRILRYYGHPRTASGIQVEMITILDLLVHESGVIYGLPYAVSWYGLKNALDEAWLKYEKNIVEPDKFEKEELLKKYPELKALSGDIKPITYISGRDYAASKAKKSRGKKKAITVYPAPKLKRDITKEWSKVTLKEDILSDKVQRILEKIVRAYKKYGRWDQALDGDTAYKIIWALFYGARDHKHIIEIFEKEIDAIPETKKQSLLQSVKNVDIYKGKKTVGMEMISDPDFLELYFFARALDIASSNILKESDLSFFETFSDILVEGTGYTGKEYLLACYGSETVLAELMEKIDNLMEQFAKFYYGKEENDKALEILGIHRSFTEKWIEERIKAGEKEDSIFIISKRKKTREIDGYINEISDVKKMAGKTAVTTTAHSKFAIPDQDPLAIVKDKPVSPEDILKNIVEKHSTGPAFMPGTPDTAVKMPIIQPPKNIEREKAVLASQKKKGQTAASLTKAVSKSKEEKLRDKIRAEILEERRIKIPQAVVNKLALIVGKMFKIEEPELFGQFNSVVVEKIDPSPEAFRAVMGAPHFTTKIMTSTAYKKMSFDSFYNIIRNAWQVPAGSLDEQTISPFADNEQKAFAFISKIDVLRGISKKQGRYVGASIWTLYKCLCATLYTADEYEYIVEHYSNSTTALPRLEEEIGEDMKYLPEMQALNTTVSEEEVDAKDKELRSKTSKYNKLETYVHILQFVTVEKYLNIYFLATFLSMTEKDIENIPVGKNAFVVYAADGLYGEGKGLNKVEEYYGGEDGIKRLEDHIFGKENGVEGFIDHYFKMGQHDKALDLLARYETYLNKVRKLKKTDQKIKEMNILKEKILAGKKMFEEAFEKEIDKRIKKIQEEEKKKAEEKKARIKPVTPTKKDTREVGGKKKPTKTAKEIKRIKNKLIKSKKALAEAKTFLAEKDIDNAQKKCEIVLKFDPDNKEVRTVMTEIAEERAKQEHLRDLKTIPGHLRDAKIALSENRINDALTLFGTILKIDPSNIAVRGILIDAADRAFAGARLSDARQICEFLIADTGEIKKEDYIEKAKELLGMIDEVESAMSVSNTLFNARKQIDQGKLVEARSMVERVIKDHPDHKEAPVLLEDITAREIAHKEEQDHNRKVNLSRELDNVFNLGRYNVALPIAEELLVLDPDDKSVADILDISKTHVEAERTREKAESLKTDDPQKPLYDLIAGTKEQTLKLNGMSEKYRKHRELYLKSIILSEESIDEDRVAAHIALLDRGYRNNAQIKVLEQYASNKENTLPKALALSALMRHGVEPEKRITALKGFLKEKVDADKIIKQLDSANETYIIAAKNKAAFQREVNKKKKPSNSDKKTLLEFQENLERQAETLEQLGVEFDGNVDAEVIARQTLAQAGEDAKGKMRWVYLNYIDLIPIFSELDGMLTKAPRYTYIAEAAIRAGLMGDDNGQINRAMIEKISKDKNMPEAARIIASSAVDKNISNEANEIKGEALKAGLAVDTHPNTRYTLIVPADFFANGEYVKHKETFGDRFDLEIVGAKNPNKYVNKILIAANGNASKKIALVSAQTSEEHLNRLTKAGIRFIRTDFEGLIENKMLPEQERESFQLNTYVIMMLARAIQKDEYGQIDPRISRVLNFYLRSHFGLDNIASDEYIDAILDGNVPILIKGILLSRPAVQYDMPNYHIVAQTLIRA